MRVALTSIEVACLKRIANGKHVAEIAEELQLSERQVAKELHDARLKLRARTNAQAVAMAVRDGLL